MEWLVARVNRALLFPATLLGMPFDLAVLILMYMVILTVYLKQFVVGPITGVFLILVSQAGTRYDPFFMDKMRIIIRFPVSGELE